MTLSQSIRIYGTASDSIVDGPGLRYAIFVQGCSHNCPGCHNPESHDPSGGIERTLESLLAEIEANRLVQGVTLSGGEPFEQCEACLELVRALRERGYNIWVYSGYRYEDLLAGRPSAHAPELLACCDVLVDGPFVQGLASYDLRWRGSSNQRVIDLAASRETGSLVPWSASEDFLEDFPEPPSSW